MIYFRKKLQNGLSIEVEEARTLVFQVADHTTDYPDLKQYPI